jgi:acetylornithine/succinyldiaminopimelate/putrescine aminotransferase
MGLPSQEPMGIEIEKAKGIYLYDYTGKEFIDLVSGVAVSNLGHLHPKVLDAIEEQLKKHLHLTVYGEIIQNPQVKLAKLLTEFLPDNLKSVYFVNSGSEANEGAMKLAKRFTGRSEIIAFKNAYHGGTHGALSILGNETLKYAFRPLLPDIKFIEFNNPIELESISDKTACVFAETIQAEAGIIKPHGDFLQKLRKKCTETGALLVIDDVQMGFGRTGKLFSFEHFGIVPDILTIAKGMGGGMPIGAFISSGEMMKTLTHHPELGHITTFGGHPVSCAAAYATLEVITSEKLFEAAEKKGRLFHKALANHPKIKEIRQIGLMLGIDMGNEKILTRLMEIFLENGIITDRFLFKPEAFRIAPPLTITDIEIEKSIKILKKSLDKI